MVQGLSGNYESSHFYVPFYNFDSYLHFSSDPCVFFCGIRFNRQRTHCAWVIIACGLLCTRSCSGSKDPPFAVRLIWRSLIDSCIVSGDKISWADCSQTACRFPLNSAAWMRPGISNPFPGRSVLGQRRSDMRAHRDR